MAFIKLSMNISVVSDTKKLSKKLNAIQRRQLPFSISKSLNSLSFQIKKDITASLPKFFHNPTGYLGRGLQIEKSSKKKLFTRIGFRSATFGSGPGQIFQADIMKLQIKGGTRVAKGRSIPVPVPANMRTNKAGNLGRGKVGKLLSNTKKYFSGIPTGIDADDGIWQRYGTKKRPKVKMVVGWEKTTSYKPRFNFKKVAEIMIKKSFRNHFEKALVNALKTAK